MNDSIYSADQNNGTYLNPIVYGNFADPSIIREGKDYYLVHGGSGYRSMLLWHSLDLVNWEPLYYVLEGYKENVWAPELVKYEDTYYIYNYGPGVGTWVITTKDIKNGPWTKPKLLEGVENIDPGHVIGEDGKRYLFMSKNIVYPLSDDGLNIIGKGIKVCEDWPIPDSFDIEGVCTESPKLIFKDGWFYLTVAEGGTFGPPTSHCTISFRSKSIFGPFEASPYNPISHTYSKTETWWSKGHGTLIDTPNGDWYIVYHGILNAHRYHGRMTLMEPIEWTEDGWFHIKDGTFTDKPIDMPKGGVKVTSDIHLSDDFKSGKLGIQWNMQSNFDIKNLSFDKDGLCLKGVGSSLHDTMPILCFNAHDSMEIITELTLDERTGGGITFYFGPKLSCGIALHNGFIKVYNMDRDWLHHDVNLREYKSSHVFLKLKNDNCTISPWYSSDGVNWTKLNLCFDISCWNSNSGSGLAWTRPGIFAFGDGNVTFHKFIYNAL